MNGKWTMKKIIGLLLGIVSLICIVISVLQEGNGIFFNIGLLCSSLGLMLIIMIKREEKN